MELPSSGAAGPNREWTKNPSYVSASRVDGVHVGGEEHGRLRLAQRDDVLDAQITQSAGAPGAFDEPADLGKDVVGERVARVVQGRIALRVLALQRHVDAEQTRAAVDPYPLGRDGDVRVARANDFPVRHHPHRGGVDAAAHIEPFDEHRPVEPRRIRGDQHHHPSGVIRCAGRRYAPSPVGAQHRRGGVGRGRAGHEELLGAVAHAGEVKSAQQQNGPARARRERPWARSCAGPLERGPHSEPGSPNFANNVSSRNATTCDNPSPRTSSTCNWKGTCLSPARMYIAAPG